MLHENQVIVGKVFHILFKKISDEVELEINVDDWNVPLVQADSQHAYTGIGDKVPTEIFFTSRL